MSGEPADVFSPRSHNGTPRTNPPVPAPEIAATPGAVDTMQPKGGDGMSADVLARLEALEQAFEEQVT